MTLDSAPDNANTNDAIVDLGGLAKILGISIDTARRKANAGDIPRFRVGRKWRFIPSKVVAHLEGQADPCKRSPQSQAAHDWATRKSGRPAP